MRAIKRANHLVGHNYKTRALATMAALALGSAGIAALGGTAAAATTAGTESFTLMSTSFTSSVTTLIATGTFTAGGTAVLSNGNGAGIPVRLPGGTFKILPRAGGNQGTTNQGTTNSKTCLYTQSIGGAYTLADGTGAYKGISGSGKASGYFRATLMRESNGMCSQSANPTAAEAIINASGHVSLPS